LYQALFALCSVLQQYLSRRLAASVCAVGFSILIASGNSPVHLFDLRSTQALYGDRKPSLLRCMTMTYMYRNLFSECLSSRTFPPWYLHEDWKATPILYLYGKKKNAMYHSTNCLAMLEREQAERRSLSRVVSLEGAGHFLYVQKHDECLKHVLAFLEAENTFSS
jgi:pimeloyl-ACP methyl ester carboxylesterase